MTTLMGRSLHMLLQSSVGWRDVLNRTLLCKELLSRIVDVLAFACAVIQEYYKPLDDMHCDSYVLLKVVASKRVTEVAGTVDPFTVEATGRRSV